MSFAPKINGNQVMLPFKGKDGIEHEMPVSFSKSKPNSKFLKFKKPATVEVQFQKKDGENGPVLYLNKAGLANWIRAVGQNINALDKAPPAAKGALISVYAGFKAVQIRTSKNPPLTPRTVNALLASPDSTLKTASVDAGGAAPPTVDLGIVDEVSTPPEAPTDLAPEVAAPQALKQPTPQTKVKPRYNGKKAVEAASQAQLVSSVTKAKVAAAVLVTSVALGALSLYLELFEAAPRTVDSIWDIGSLDDIRLYVFG